jgi:hypothetical protein
VQKLRQFSFIDDYGVEYQHPFAKRIWLECKVDGRTQRVAPYISLVEISERLTAAQYYCIQTILLRILTPIRKKLNTTKAPTLSGATWQDLHMLEKAFSLDFIQRELDVQGLRF